MESSKSSRQLGTPPLGRMLDDLMPMARRSRSRSNQDRGRFVSRHKSKPQQHTERWRLMVSGDVQGVGFRNACLRRATELSLCGWVKNLSDGRVEVQAEGGSFALSELRMWCERGPAGSQVHMVRVSQLPTTGDDWFEIKHS